MKNFPLDKGSFHTSRRVILDPAYENQNPWNQGTIFKELLHVIWRTQFSPQNKAAKKIWQQYFQVPIWIWKQVNRLVVQISSTMLIKPINIWLHTWKIYFVKSSPNSCYNAFSDSFKSSKWSMSWAFQEVDYEVLHKKPLKIHNIILTLNSNWVKAKDT